MATATTHREDVELLRRRFAGFRQTHAARSRLPEEWWAAAKLVRRDGLPATARALEVDQPSLKKWTERFEPQARQRRTRRVAAPAFVELLAAGPAQKVGLPGRSGIAARSQTPVRVFDDRSRGVGGTDSRVRVVLACWRSRRRCGSWRR